MPDFIGDPSEEKKEEKVDPNKEILDSLTSLKTSLEELSTKVNDIDTRTTPVEEEEEETEEHFAPKTWDDVPAKAAEIAEEIVEVKFEEIKAEAEAQKEAAVKQQQVIDSYIDTQVTSLEKAEKLPKVENASDEDDPGRSARRELFGLAARVGTMDLEKTSEIVDILHKSGYSYDPRADNGKGTFIRSGSMPSGINAPVASSSRSAGFSQGQPSYKDIHNTSVDTMIARVMGE